MNEERTIYHVNVDEKTLTDEYREWFIECFANTANTNKDESWFAPACVQRGFDPLVLTHLKPQLTNLVKTLSAKEKVELMVSEGPNGELLTREDTEAFVAEIKERAAVKDAKVSISTTADAVFVDVCVVKADPIEHIAFTVNVVPDEPAEPDYMAAIRDIARGS